MNKWQYENNKTYTKRDKPNTFFIVYHVAMDELYFFLFVKTGNRLLYSWWMETSSRFSSNSEAFASDLLENIEKVMNK